MSATRKFLKAENDQLRAQIAVHNHVTRKALNETVRLTRESNESLKAELKKRDETIEKLTAELALATAPKDEVAA